MINVYLNHPYSVSTPTGVLQFNSGMKHLELTQTRQVNTDPADNKTALTADQLATNLGHSPKPPNA